MTVTEIILTTGQSELNGAKLSLYCPEAAGTTVASDWFKHLLAQLLNQDPTKAKMRTNEAATTFLFVDKKLITAIAITLG